MVESIGKCVVLHIILLSQSSWYTLVMTSYKKDLSVAKFLLTQNKVDTEEHRHTIMPPMGFKPTILILTLHS